jgi:hypothetical protein
MRIQRRLRPGRTPIPPHRLNQLTDINPPPRINQQPGQQPAQNRATRRTHLPAFDHIDRPEVAEPQRVPHDSTHPLTGLTATILPHSVQSG